MNDRWPFVFDLDDIEVDEIEGTTLDQEKVAGVRVTHVPSGTTSLCWAFKDNRDENISIALRRLDRRLRKLGVT